MIFKIECSYSGVVRLVTVAIAVVMVVYHMWAIGFGSPEAVWFRGTHLLFAMVLTFLIFRATGNRRRDRQAWPITSCSSSAQCRSSICSSTTITSSIASSTSTI